MLSFMKAVKLSKYITHLQFMNNRVYLIKNLFFPQYSCDLFVAPIKSLILRTHNLLVNQWTYLFTKILWKSMRNETHECDVTCICYSGAVWVTSSLWFHIPKLGRLDQIDTLPSPLQVWLQEITNHNATTPLIFMLLYTCLFYSKGTSMAIRARPCLSKKPENFAL